jgi:hypothetical protein
MTTQDKRDFNEYLRMCTDQQVLGVYEKERNAGRRSYAALARAEAQRRNLW